MENKCEWEKDGGSNFLLEVAPQASPIWAALLYTTFLESSIRKELLVALLDDEMSSDRDELNLKAYEEAFLLFLSVCSVVTNLSFLCAQLHSSS